MTSSRSSGSGHGSAEPRTIGPYELLLELGRGSNGAVFLARRPGLDRLYAVKVLTGRVDRESEERFAREARLASRLSHPGVVSCLEIGHEPRLDRSYLVMDFVPGRTLQQQLEVERQLEPRAAATLVAEVAEAVAAAHDAGVVHRDLKPANILLDSRSGRARVSDFGLARDLHASRALTRTGEVLGTPYYMAPEQVRGERGGPRTDVYALGVILYEALAGRRPFEAHAVTELAQKILEGKHPPIRATRPRVPGGLERVCERALALEPERRFGSPRELAQALRDEVRRLDATEASAPPPPGSRAPALALAAAAGMLALAVGLVAGRLSAPAPAAPVAALPSQELTAARAALEQAEADRLEDAAELGQLRETLARRERRLDYVLRELDQHAQLVVGLREQTAAALETLAVRLEQEPAQLVRARLLEYLGRVDAALALLRELPDERRTPAGLCLQHRLGLLTQRRADVERAAELLRPLAEDDPAAADYLTVAEALQARGPVPAEAVDRAMRSEHPQEELLWLVTTVYNQTRRLDGAIDVAGRYLRRAPLQADMLQVRAVDYWQRWLTQQRAPDLEASLADLLWARQIRPLPVQDWLNPGICLVSLDRPLAARHELREALRQRGPESQRNRARVWLGNAALLLGEPEEARRWWLEAIETDLRSASEVSEYLSLAPPDLREEVERRFGGQLPTPRYQVTWGDR